MFLFDTFTGLAEDYSSENERAIVGYALKDPAQWYVEVRDRFAPYPNVEVVRGVVPDVLNDNSPAAVAFLHLDMNAAAAEVGALDALFERVCDGGIILMDDYGRYEYAELHAAPGGLDGRARPIRAGTADRSGPGLQTVLTPSPARRRRRSNGVMNSRTFMTIVQCPAIGKCSVSP